ncbi:HlyD family secretion protein, partial [Natronospora cellulosivora (SeqCode)]
MKKILIIVGVVIVLVAGFILATGDSEQVSGPARMVTVVEAEEEAMITTVSADGRAVPELEREVKGNLNGTLDEVFVERGSFVEKGRAIYRMDDNRLLSSLETARLDLHEARGNYQSLLDNYNNQDRRNNLRLEESRRNLEIQLLSYQNEENSLNERKTNLEDQMLESKENMEKALETLEDNRILYERDAIPYNTLKQHEDNYRQAKRNYDRAKSNYELFINNTIVNSLELAQLRVANARNQLESLEASIEADKITEKDLELARNRVRRVESQIRDIERDIERITAYAPITGTVIEIGVKEGDTVVEGATVAKIADLSSFIIEAMVDEIHINRVALDQEVNVSSDAFDEELEGIVQFIAPSGSQVGNLNKYQVDILVSDDKGLLRPSMHRVSPFFYGKQTKSYQQV